MSIRVCLRVRERRDVDLILDKGMLAAGWHAHTLDAPGKFYVLADGHNQPRRARGYLVTDDHVRETAARYAELRPELDDLSVAAIDHQPRAPEPPTMASNDPEQALLTALEEAPEDGVSIPELIDATGMRRTWIYDRLQALAGTDSARQVSRGRWRA